MVKRLFSPRDRFRNRCRAAESFVDFLHRATAFELLKRLDDITEALVGITGVERKDNESPRVAILGAADGHLAHEIAGKFQNTNVFALENVPNFVKKQSENSKFVTVLCSEDGFENPLPFLQKNGQYALILSHLTLHAANDVLGTLIQIYQSLSVAGCFIGVAPGGGTLQELRGVFLEADISMQNGASPRIFPMGQIQDWGLLMQKAGFAFVAVDTNKLTVWYNDPLKLMHDLRYIGEANALYERTRKITKRSVFEELCRLYRKQWGRADGKVPASFEMIYFIGWKIDNRHSSYEKISLALQGLLSK